MMNRRKLMMMMMKREKRMEIKEKGVRRKINNVIKRVRQKGLNMKRNKKD